MRFTITPLGSAGGRTVGQVVDDIVRYLEPRSAASASVGAAPGLPQGEGPSSYYADRGTEPGRWLGQGASEVGLVGAVDAADFGRVMSGRDPRTGARLITAQGSSGRTASLGAGTETRCDVDGTPLYGLDDVAASLGVTKQEAAALIAAGERATLGVLAGGSVTEPAGSYLVPLIDRSDNRWIRQDELDRIEDARSRGIEPDEVAAAGSEDDQLSVRHAARLSGLSARYLRSLCRRYDDNTREIDAAVASGRRVRRAYLVGHRGTKGQWLVTRKEVVAFLGRRIAPAVRVGYDLTLTTEKSLGVLALLGDNSTRQVVLDAIEAGNDRGLHHLEYHAALGRARGEQVGTRGWTVASFRHLTSRALDPFPHHHNVVANTVVDEHRTRRALDARHIYWQAQTASALATAEMRHRLTQQLGVRWRPGRSGGWEIDGISEEVLREFSQRRSEIDDAIAELEDAIGRRTSLHEVQQVITSTRPAKKAVDPTSLVEGWWARAQDHGLTPEILAACTGRWEPLPALDRDAVFELLVDPGSGLCATGSTFTRADVLGALVDLPCTTEQGTQPLLLSAEELKGLADEFLASDCVIPLEPRGLELDSTLARHDLFTTPEILRVQQQILDRYCEGRTTQAGTVSAALLDRTLADSSLSGEQKRLVEAFCTSGRAVQCAIGRAGTGKTTSMRAAAAAWTSAGYSVIGTAVKGEAARHLAAGAGIPTETVAWFLARRDRSTLPIDERTVLIVDEASTLSDRDLHALLDIARERGAAVRLVGDPAQHGAVAAGGMFRHLCDLHAEHTPELVTTHRLADPAERAAVDALRHGDIDTALDQLASAGKLHIADDDLDLYVGMLQRWWSAHQDGDHHPMVDRRHHTRRQLNRLARQLRRANGELGDTDIVATGDRHFAAGDRVVARMAARHLYVSGRPDAYIRNGATGTIEFVDQGSRRSDDTVNVTFDGIGTITVPRQFLDEHDGPGGRRDVGLDHAYAVTSYAVQGATYDTSTSRIDDNATRSEAYVDLTRGRQANHLFLTRSADPLDGEQLPKVPPPPVVEAVVKRLRTSGPERPAIELDAEAASIVCDASGLPARRLGARRAVLRSAHQPPEDVVDRLPQESSVPYLRSRRTEAMRRIVEYRHLRMPEADETVPYGWALGRPIDGALEERESIASDLDELALANVDERLAALGWDSLPAWAAGVVTSEFAFTPGLRTPQALDDLLLRVADHRDRHGLSPEELPPAGRLLGAAPDDPVERARHQMLEHDLELLTTPVDLSRSL